MLTVRKNVKTMILYFVLITITPDFSSFYTFYFKDYLMFTDTDFADISSICSVFMALGMLFYYWKLKNIPPHLFFALTLGLCCFFNFSFYLVVYGVIDKMGLSNKWFCVFTLGINSLIGQLNFMPVLSVWCALAPKNLEGTSVTMITGINNLAAQFSGYLGSFMLWLFKFKEGDFSKTWLLVTIENFYGLFLLFFVCMFDFPDVRGTRIFCLNFANNFGRFKMDLL